jgi:hypothetical protein
MWSITTGASADDSVRRKIERVVERSDSDLPQITQAVLAKAFRDRKYHGQWDHVLFSGMVCAVAYGIASDNLSLGIAFMVGATAYGLLIVNPNMGFSPVQKFVATGLMLGLARYGRTILEFFFSK